MYARSAGKQVYIRKVNLFLDTSQLWSN